jgi:hypothetical protein
MSGGRLVRDETTVSQVIDTTTRYQVLRDGAIVAETDSLERSLTLYSALAPPRRAAAVYVVTTTRTVLHACARVDDAPPAPPAPVQSTQGH